MRKTILLPRRDPESLSLSEREALRQIFGDEIELIRIDPEGPSDHLRLCKEYCADAVFLSGDRPIQSDAMEEGYPHIVIIEGQVMRLHSFETKLGPFEYSNQKR